MLCFLPRHEEGRLGRGGTILERRHTGQVAEWEHPIFRLVKVVIDEARLELELSRDFQRLIDGLSCQSRFSTEFSIVP